MKHNNYEEDKKFINFWWWYVDESVNYDSILEEWFKESLDKYKYSILQYWDCFGFNDLRLEIVKWAPNFFKIPRFNYENIIITNWITNALDVVWRIILKKEYDSFILEPIYDTAICNLKNNSRKIHSLNIGWNDWYFDIKESNYESIEKLFRTQKIKLFYIIPNYSNPTWLTLKLEDREKLWKLCKKYWVYIFEDDPYWVYNYTWNYIKTFYELFNDIVIYANSFSKIWFPWLRIWFIVTKKEIIDKFAELQKYTYSSPNLISQSIIEYLIKNNQIDNIFSNRKEIMKKKYILLKTHLLDIGSITLNIPMWGFYIWINIKKIDNFLKKSEKNWLKFIPWSIYWYKYEFNNYIRMSFSQIDINLIEFWLDKIKIIANN